MHCTQCGQALEADEQFCPVCGAPREASGMTFEQAEQEYFRLRGQLDTHRLTPEQFDNALKQLMVQDAQGRYWMLGAESGAWYVYDGQQWVRANRGAPDAASLNAPRKSAAPFAILGLLGLVLLVLLALGAYWFLQPRNSGSASGNQNAALITSTPASGVALAATGAPLPTLAPIAPTNPPPTVAIPTVLQPTAVPTSAIPTVAQALPSITLPVSTVVVIVEAATAILMPPTETPPPSPQPTVTATWTRVPPTRAPSPTATLAPTEIPTPAYPPGVYVTQIKTEPAEPKRNQGVAFQVSFLNTTGVTQQYNWLVQIYDAESNKRFGETQVLSLTVPPGESVQISPGNWQVTGAGGCISLYAQAQFQNADTGRIPFTATNGDPFSYWFNVCP